VKKHYPEANSNLKLLAASILLGLFFLYCLWGAIGGELLMPSRPRALVLQDTAAWIACLFAPLWFIGEFFLHSTKISMPSNMRRAVHAIFLIAAIASAFCATLWYRQLAPTGDPDAIETALDHQQLQALEANTA